MKERMSRSVMKKSGPTKAGGQLEEEEPRKGDPPKDERSLEHPEEKDIGYEKMVEEQKNLQAVGRDRLEKLRRYMEDRDEIYRI